MKKPINFNDIQFIRDQIIANYSDIYHNLNRGSRFSKYHWEFIRMPESIGYCHNDEDGPASDTISSDRFQITMLSQSTESVAFFSYNDNVYKVDKPAMYQDLTQLEKIIDHKEVALIERALHHLMPIFDGHPDQDAITKFLGKIRSWEYYFRSINHP